MADIVDHAQVGRTRIVCSPKSYGPMRPGKRLESAEFGVGKVVEV
ncbi:hypothetical protein [Methylocystis parvus]|nr:hypothetical protein [Methylocystis parvus]